MTKSILLLSTVLFLTSCASLQNLSQNLLEKRADYKHDNKVKTALEDLNSTSLLAPKRTQSKTADIWVHPHEMPTGDYFLGGWVRMVISPSQWEM